MSVLIKGMKMPKDGVYWCEIGVAGNIATITIHGEDRKSFHLIELPDHGDLIERPILIDELAISEEPDDCRGCVSYNSYDDFCCMSLDFQNMCRSIRAAPVVIPAERSEE